MLEFGDSELASKRRVVDVKKDEYGTYEDVKTAYSDGKGGGIFKLSAIKGGYVDYAMILVVFFLAIFGLIMLFSTSSYEAGLKFDDQAFYLKKQIKEEKEKSIKNAPFGIVGLETAFALTVTELLGDYLDMKSLVERMSLTPAKLLKNGKGTLKEGSVADLVVADINEEYVIDSDKFLSKGKNTPFNGKKVRGKVLYTLCGGKVVFKEEK